MLTFVSMKYSDVLKKAELELLFAFCDLGGRCKVVAVSCLSFAGI